MFILDDNAVVRMVDMATKVVTSLAGGGGPQAPGAGDSDGCHKTNQRVDGVGTSVIFNQPQDPPQSIDPPTMTLKTRQSALRRPTTITVHDNCNVWRDWKINPPQRSFINCVSLIGRERHIIQVSFNDATKPA
jgi:hypothetical protein